MQELQLEMLKLNERLDQNEKQLNERLDQNEKQPFLFICAAQLSYSTYKIYKAVNYHTLLYSSTNVEEGGLDICTGVFTSGQPGTYSITWSSVSPASGKGNYIVLRKNGKNIPESQCTWTQ